MEKNQRDHILKYLDMLVEGTTCNSSLISVLLEESILTPADVFVLDSVSNRLQRSYKFYKLVQTRLASYKILIEALRKSNQNGAADILENLERPHSPSVIAEDVRIRVKRLLEGLEDDRRKKNPKQAVIWFDVKLALDLFTGRKQELAEIHNKIKSKSGTPVVISQVTSISGLGGIGKTELTRKYLQEHKQDLHNVIWINAEREENMIESFRRLAKDELGISTKDANRGEKDILTVVKDVYNYFQDKEVTFVFDNAEKGDLLGKFMPINFLHPNAKQPYILITSRDREWPVGVEVINLNELDLEDAIEFVKKGLEIVGDVENEQILILVQKLQCFPLALHQAISFIKDQSELGNFSILDYIQEYESNREEFLNSEISEFFNDYTKTTFTTWKMTVGRIARDERYGFLANKILNFAAYFAPDNILRETFSPLAENQDRKLKNAVRLLVKYSMMNAEQLQSILHIHRLVQEVTRIELVDENKELEVLTKVLKLIRDDLRSENLNHALSAWNHAKKHNELVKEFSKLPGDILKGLFDKVRFDEAINFGKAAYDTLSSNLPQDHLDILKVKDLLAEVLSGQGKYDEALSKFEEVLEKRRIIQGYNHPDCLTVLFKIGNIFYDQTKYEEALQTYLQVFEKRVEVLGQNHLETVKAMNNIGGCYAITGKHENALLMYEDARNKYREINGEENEFYLQAVHNIGLLYGSLGRLDESVLGLRECLAKSRGVLEPNNPFALQIRHNLSLQLFKIGEYQEAFEILKDVKEIKIQVLGEEHPETVSSKNLLGKICLVQGKFNETLEIHRGTYLLYSRKLGENNYRALISKRDIGMVLMHQGLHEEALVILGDAIGGLEAIMGPNQDAVLDSKLELVKLLIKIEDYGGAVKILREVKNVYDEHYGGRQHQNYNWIVRMLISIKGGLLK